MADSENIDVFLSNHAGLDATLAKLDALEARKSGEPHPVVGGSQSVKRAMNVLRLCVTAQLASFDPPAAAAN